MRALVYPAYGELEFRANAPEPEVAAGEVLVKVQACGICGSELGSFASQSKRRVPPIVMGHEFSGTVAEVGPGIEGLKPGQRVMVNALVHCGACDLCRRGLTHLCRNRQVFGMHRPGAFAEWVNVPANVVYPLPDNVSMLQGAMVEPLGNGIHVVALAKGNTLKTVLVCGAGTIGLMCFLAARAAGAQRVALSDTSDARLEVARGLGADFTINARSQNVQQAVSEWTDGLGVELAVDAVGAESTRVDAIRATRPGGDVVWIGLHHDEAAIPTFEVVLPERRIMGSYAATDADIRRAIQLFSEGKAPLDPWTHVFPLEEGAEVFLDMVHQRRPTIKAVLTP
jgi:threonine dehydrogenase-like Zn-dependent dehydrogenase